MKSEFHLGLHPWQLLGKRTLRLSLIFAAAIAFQISLPAKTISVPAGGNLQDAINHAAQGDTIVLQPGKIYPAFRLVNAGPKALYITIETQGITGMRATPSRAVSFAKIVTTANSPAISADSNAHHWRLVGLEVYACKAAVYPCPAKQGISFTSAMVDLGPNGLPSDLELDRLYIHGHPVAGAKRGIALNSSNTTIRNSYISDFKSKDQEAQAIGSWSGAKDCLIENNYVEGSAQNVLIGGTSPSAAIPTGLRFLRNHFAKPMSWKTAKTGSVNKTAKWIVKNLFELKYAKDVVIDGNVFENTWVQALADHQLYAIVFTVRAHTSSVPNAVLENITFTNNVVRHAPGGVNILGEDYNSPFAGNAATCKDKPDPGTCKFYGKARNITIENNLFYDIDAQKWAGYGNSGKWTPGSGIMFTITWAPQNVTINHNTLIQTNGGNPGGSALILFARDRDVPPVPSAGFSFLNNLGYYGLRSDGFPNDKGTAVLKRWTAGCDDASCPLFQRNALIGGNAFQSQFPSLNYFPVNDAEVKFTSVPKSDYSLQAASPFKGQGADGKDVGADVRALLSAALATVQGN